MNKSTVALVRCPSYNSRELRLALESCLDLVGGWGQQFKRGRHVFVKINHLSAAASPDQAITTHPGFTREVISLLKDAGVRITVGDDILYRGEDGYEKTGFRAVCRELDVTLVNLKEGGFKEVRFDGMALKSAYLSRLALEADAVLNLPKLKTHSFTSYTGAVKNMFGLVPQGLRLAFHRRFFQRDIFSRMLVDVFSCLPPHLTIMDAVVGMEGEGPSAGRPRRIGLVLAGRNAVAVDAVAASVIGIRPMDIETIRLAAGRGVGPADLNDIEIAGEKLEDVRIDDFRHSVISGTGFRSAWAQAFFARVQTQLTYQPEVRPEACTACFHCRSICPARAIKRLRGKAWIHSRECIHCMCCHEICSSRAIRLRQRPAGRMIRIAERVYQKIGTRLG